MRSTFNKHLLLDSKIKDILESKVFYINTETNRENVGTIIGIEEDRLILSTRRQIVRKIKFEHIKYIEI